MRDQIRMIIPTRGRPQNALELAHSWLANSDGAHSMLEFWIDDDDPEREAYWEVLDDLLYVDGHRIDLFEGPRLRLIKTLNEAAVCATPLSAYVGFMGDDHRFRTPNWDVQMIKALESQRYGVAYGNDLIQGEYLPTAVVMSASIIDALGYMVPPQLIHFYADNFWRDLANAIEKRTYMPEIIIEHMHFSVGKSELDESYKETNQSPLMLEDQARYDEYMRTRFALDVQKVLEYHK